MGCSRLPFPGKRKKEWVFPLFTWQKEGGMGCSRLPFPWQKEESGLFHYLQYLAKGGRKGLFHYLPGNRREEWVVPGSLFPGKRRKVGCSIIYSTWPKEEGKGCSIIFLAKEGRKRGCSIIYLAKGGRNGLFQAPLSLAKAWRNGLFLPIISPSLWKSR